MEAFQENKNNIQKQQRSKDLPPSPLSSTNALVNVSRKLSEKEMHKSVASSTATGAVATSSLIPSLTDEDRKILKKVKYTQINFILIKFK